INIYFRLAHFFILAGQPKNALPYLETIINFPLKEVRPRMQTMSHLLKLVALLDLHQFETLERTASESIVILKRAGRYSQFEKLVIEMILQLAEGNNVKILRKSFQAAFSEFFSNPENKHWENYFDFIAWFLAAESGMSMMDWF